MNYSTAALVPSAAICTKTATGSNTVTVKAGDTLTDVVLQAGRRERTIASATVKGFIGGNKVVKRGETTIWDGVPSYMRDEDGDAHFGTIDETVEIRAIVVEIPAEEEGAAPTVETIKVANIKSLSASEGSSDAGATESGSETVTE